MSTTNRTVLITGCSNESGLGAALALAFHKAGLHVYATARNASSMSHLAKQGIETLSLDVESDSSIAACVSQIPHLDILVNNAGGPSTAPFTDMSIPAAKKVFDLNVWAQVAMTQAFLPLLMKSPHPMIVNQTSVSAVAAVPFQAAYNGSKAALAMMTDVLRLELRPFGITVVDLRTGLVDTGALSKPKEGEKPYLPKDSIFQPARDIVEKALRREGFQEGAIAPEEWAKGVVGDLLRKNPPSIIWRGGSAWLAWVATMLPFGMLDGVVKKMTGLDLIEKALRK